MSKIGLMFVKLFGKDLSNFKSQKKAEQYFKKYIDRYTKILEKLSKYTNEFTMDFSPESLKKIELWYFNLYESNKFSEIGTDRSIFEKCIAVYFGNVVIKNVDNAHWDVSEYPFIEGKYEFGVTKDIVSIMLTKKFNDLYKIPSNKKKQSIFRMYKKYFI
jgi:hypothetical protein